MVTQLKNVQNTLFPVFKTHVLIVGSGTAALAAAVHLKRGKVQDLLIVTDNKWGGTSRNTGSDKQTYYRLSDSEKTADSPYDMAETLYQGGAMHGDIALVESLLSPRAFYNLVALGVSFPHNRYGGYTGYKTDHDFRCRGTSIGPYTSKEMTEVLFDETVRLKIPLWDHHDAVKIITHKNRAVGAVFLNKRELDKESFGLKIVLADNIVFGTGGPGGFYSASVYPRVQTGGIGLALEAGAAGINLTESQFGIASVKIRWNLSGSYQQVLPSYYSTDRNGRNKQYFLIPYFSTYKKLTEAVFLKGYQWPFDPLKVKEEGSSLIDLLVFIEKRKRRRVFIDYRENLKGNSDDSSDTKSISRTAMEYLEKSGARGDTPLERLEKLNPDAVDLFKSHGIDLSKEPLEIDVCAQHNNGGLSGDIWWESVNLKRLFPVGEVNGTHGIYRPGGSALNSGQVGAIRAARRIAVYGSTSNIDIQESLYPAIEGAKYIHNLITKALSNRESEESPENIRIRIQKRMTESGGFVRSFEGIGKAVSESEHEIITFPRQKLKNRWQIPLFLKNRHMVIAHFCYLSAIQEYLKSGGGSRGSYIVLDPDGIPIHPELKPEWTMLPENRKLKEFIQLVVFDSEIKTHTDLIKVREIPYEEFWFETVWDEYKNRKY